MENKCPKCNREIDIPKNIRKLKVCSTNLRFMDIYVISDQKEIYFGFCSLLRIKCGKFESISLQARDVTDTEFFLTVSNEIEYESCIANKINREMTFKLIPHDSSELNK